VFFTLAANLIVSLPASYIIARRRQKWLSFGILFTQMTPWIVFLLPWYIIFKALGLYDTYIGLVLANLTFMVPFTIWLMLGFFEDVPVEVEEAAWLDGCSNTGTFIRIVIPLVKGGIITISTLGFMGAWNIFIFPLVLSGAKSKTLPVLVYNFLADNSLDFGPLSAASVLITLPVIIFVLINQKYFARGIALGGRK
jgi:multiple sugar transport system permease protein